MGHTIGFMCVEITLLRYNHKKLKCQKAIRFPEWPSELAYF
jgi:hypothetical protein